jgi:hypothetical protein
MIVVGLFREAEAALVRLDAKARAIHADFWRFLNDPFRDPRRGKRLRLRLDRDAQGHVDGICWTKRLRDPVKTKDGRIIYATRRLRGGLRRSWVALIAHSIDRLDGYRKIERERVRWTRARARVVRARMRLKLWLDNGWAPRATEREWARARALARRHALGECYVKSMAGAITLGGELLRREGDLRSAVEAWWRAYDHRADVPFRPQVMAGNRGGCRLRWRRRGWTRSSHGHIPFGKYISDRPTVKWMIAEGLSPEVRRQLSPLIVVICRFDGLNRELVRKLGAHRSRCGAACSAVPKKRIAAQSCA